MDTNGKSKRDRLLLIGEELYTVFLLLTYLESCGYAVASARNSHDSLNFLQSETPDLILFCDDDSLTTDSYTFLQGIRALPQTQQTPVILVSSRNQTLEQARCLNKTMDAYMVQPVDLDRLQQQVQAMIHRKLSLV